jgi:hypothetical protein
MEKGLITMEEFIEEPKSPAGREHPKPFFIYVKVRAYHTTKGVKTINKDGGI